MVRLHSRAQPDSGEKTDDSPTQVSESSDSHADASQRPEDEDTLLTLSSKMSEQQKQLADLPDTVKMYPQPDVVECCLVLLHISKSSPSIPESLQQEAKDLLRKYGTSPSFLKASRRFLT
ncbi:Gem-associated protein 5 [Larimichthys crocea]|uniref:Uncharacterized protein n=1 Tax=Larimichthys crocea TaxID=215358 RepID=A0ACD3R2V8_LARCR|nr:Gem-associated protein 5 [Larimichthys crocea]